MPFLYRVMMLLMKKCGDFLKTENDAADSSRSDYDNFTAARAVNKGAQGPK
jgi:hypothetical protein